ncbi:MAG: hypothetical protein QM296_07930 [Bacillota bacterium]|nr:hypothetical protein [Bacillota bacterium]
MVKVAWYPNGFLDYAPFCPETGLPWSRSPEMAIVFAITRCFDQNQAFCGQDRLKWQLDLPLHAVLTRNRSSVVKIA